MEPAKYGEVVLGYGFGSLKLLRDLGTATVTVDTTTTYASWADLVATVGGILDLEAGGPTARAIAVHAPDYDRAVNPGDHNDHCATAEAVRAAVGRRPWDLTWYVDYRTRDLPVNLAAAAHADKTKEFLASDRPMVAAGFGSIASQPSYQAWLWRRYDRTERGGHASAGACQTQSELWRSRAKYSAGRHAGYARLRSLRRPPPPLRTISRPMPLPGRHAASSS
jgi:hypothetical protein